MGWRRKERDSIPFPDKHVPPSEVRPESCIESDLALRLWDRVKQIKHPPQEGSARSHHLAGMVEKAYEGFQLFARADFLVSPLMEEGL